MKLIVVEDDPKVARLLKKGLGEEGFIVDVCHDGAAGLELALVGGHDLMILDVMLPGIDGWGVLQHLRGEGSTMPIVMLTARDSIAHRIRGLSQGADDYLVKPFSFGELVARVNAVLRRRRSTVRQVLTIQDLVFDVPAGYASRGDQRLELTAKELALLELLMSRQGEVLSRTTIAEAVWDMAFESDSNVIDVSIRRLRAKVDDPFSVKLIETVRGRGYVIR